MSPDWEELLARYLDGRLSPEEMASLSTRLENSAEDRRRFEDWLNLDAALGSIARAREAASDPGPRRVAVDARMGLLRAAAAILVLLVGVSFLWVKGRPFATVTGVAGSDWGGPNRLRGGEYSLEAGTLELRTARGAEVVIEAPATFCFESAQRLRLASGRLAAEVPPPAQGFTVVTPDGDAVDLGTRFGVDVRSGGGSEIHVFEGEVIARASKLGSPRSLRHGQALAMNGGGGDRRELRSAAFIQSEEVPSLRAGLEAGQEAASARANEALRGDPDLLHLLTFEEEDSHPGVFRWVQGRWPGSRAAEFVEAGDHLKLSLGTGADYPRLTLAAWVRLDHLGAPYQSLLHTDGWSEDNPGQVHWMINGDATMRLALRGNRLAPGAPVRHGFPDSRTPVLPEQGRWVHLAVTYDSDAGTVRFFLNGRFDQEIRQSVALPARLGPAQIGNWDQQDRKLSGRIDELVLLRRVLGAEEIAKLFEAGTPYR